MTERTPKPYTAPDGKTRQAKGPSEHAAAIEAAGQSIADALRTLPSAYSWDGLRLAVKHHGQGTEAAGEAIANAIVHTLSDAVDNASNELAGIAGKQGDIADATLGVARSIDGLAEAVAGDAAAIQAEALRDVGRLIRAGLERIATVIEDRPA